ncbi:MULTISPECIES: mitochondrial fission ELM1 family protein [unclassified Commensalibacter]|uniref:mitochondrial fission ELM1 family protein n=1 Tax=unclassified Commensalibacter TaxID=2630218 RepID=UPI0018DD9173|nr:MULTISPECIES: mitochondrial fission ELM1 family protein [unclassified Commensalibacter]MBH9970059.1 mitochondrial fission ELM1 family protein [Commensalibacter sp. M0265]MBH9977045.1 mitochondrial fission ELM1 family protein [Commensalibacter sp. M0266]MBH9993094.1 mitochondrial fission ELM1 family protein [Commensalibacter sp. M0270]MBI0046221.1 mitochondrial fission ELM1 family protein [Commensalibacter sp. M0267]MBI0056259.1 mitochondrial fission ELM1 family protein [Commensalibacter sp.
MTEVSILTENFAGMKTQALGFVKRAQFDYSFHQLKPRFPWKFISAPFWPNPLKAVFPFQPKDNSVIVSVGSVGGVVNADLRKKNHIAIHIQNPRIALNKFDLIIANPHDNIKADNVLVSRNALHHITPSLLSENLHYWNSILHDPVKPLVSVLLGGNNGRFKFGVKEAEQIAYQLKRVITKNNISLAVTPSRRTNPSALKRLKEILSPFSVYIWNGEGENPYLGLLACADYILVTIDSVSMVSEAIATSVPVMILPLPGKSKRISSFINSMFNEKRIRMFEGKLETWRVTSIDDTDEIINQAKLKLKL